jgi:hypothetical protein
MFPSMIPAISLSKACDAILGKPLYKNEQTSNWEAAELSPSQLTYAALDAHCLLGILHAVMGRIDFSPSGVEVNSRDFPKLGESPHAARCSTPSPHASAATAFVLPDIGVAGMYSTPAVTSSSSSSSVAANSDSVSADMIADSIHTRTAPIDMESGPAAEKPLKSFLRENPKRQAVTITLAQFFSDIG